MFFVPIFFLCFSLSMFPSSYDHIMNTLQQGNISDGLEKIQQLLVNNAQDGEMLYNAGLAAHKTEKYEDASRYFSLAAKQTEDQALREKIEYNHALSEAAHGNIQEAISLFEHVLSINPDNHYASHNVAVLREQQRQKEQEDQQQQQKNNQNQQQNQQDQQNDNQDNSQNNDSDKQDQHDDQGQQQKNNQNNQENKQQNNDQEGNEQQKDQQNQPTKDSKESEHYDQHNKQNQKENQQDKEESTQSESDTQHNETQKQDNSPEQQQTNQQKPSESEQSKKQETENNQKNDRKESEKQAEKELQKGKNSDSGKEQLHQKNHDSRSVPYQQSDKNDSVNKENAQELLLQKILTEQDELDQAVQEQLMKIQIQKMGGKKGGKHGW